MILCVGVCRFVMKIGILCLMYMCMLCLSCVFDWWMIWLIVIGLIIVLGCFVLWLVSFDWICVSYLLSSLVGCVLSVGNELMMFVLYCVSMSLG